MNPGENSPDVHRGERLHPVQVRAWKAMSYEEKWRLAKQANHLLREGVRGRIRRKNPGFSEEEIERATSRALLLSRT